MQIVFKLHYPWNVKMLEGLRSHSLKKKKKLKHNRDKLRPVL